MVAPYLFFTRRGYRPTRSYLPEVIIERVSLADEKIRYPARGVLYCITIVTSLEECLNLATSD